MSICLPPPTIIIDGLEAPAVYSAMYAKEGVEELQTLDPGTPDPVTESWHPSYHEMHDDEPFTNSGSATGGYSPTVDAPDDQIPADIRGDVLNPKTIPTPDTEKVQIVGNLDYGMKISKHVVLAAISKDAVAQRGAFIRPQCGLSKEQIVNNLKALSTHIIDPIFDKYPGGIITSGFRPGSGRSQHCRGQAVDMQWPGQSHSASKALAKWILDTLPFDQLILEKSLRSGNYWIHCSFNPAGNRSPDHPCKFGTMTGGQSYVWRRLFV